MYKELALITSYIAWARLLKGTIFETFDASYHIAVEFYKKYPDDSIWGLEDGNLEWSETLEAFVLDYITDNRQFSHFINH